MHLSSIWLAMNLLLRGAPAYEPTSAYSVRPMEGWKVYVNKRLLADQSGLPDESLKLFSGKLYNINADDAATAIACALNARKLVFLTDVPGLLLDPADPSTLISSLHLNEVDELIERGVIGGGMLPKVKGMVSAVQSGIRKVHIINSSMPHSLLLELFTPEGVGTEITE